MHRLLLLGTMILFALPALAQQPSASPEQVRANLEMNLGNALTQVAQFRYLHEQDERQLDALRKQVADLTTKCGKLCAPAEAAPAKK